MAPARRVLLVDDDPDWLALARESLESSGYEVDQVERGAEALRRIDSGPYLAVLIDLRMPSMDGWVLAARIRERAGPRMPVILLTGVEDQRGLSDGLLAGANCYLSKSGARQGRLPRLVQDALGACQ